MGVVLAVNGEAVGGRNMSDVCALNRPQKRCFMMSYHVGLRFASFVYSKRSYSQMVNVMLNCLVQ